MRDEDFDKLLKQQMQEDEYIPQNINQLFSDFEMEVNMKENKTKVIKFKDYLRTASIAASLMIVVFVGESTYAHVNGKETIISPLLRNLGINSKYEENATEFNKEVTQKEVKVKLTNGAIDDTTLIVGYEIEIENNNPDNWIEINGDYKINNITVKPINYSIDKLSDTTYTYYQVFDVNEIKIDNKEKVKIEANFYEIKEYTENETKNSVEAAYGETHTDEWKLQENITVKNLEESKTYEFTNSKNYEVMENVNISITNFITGSYTNMLKIKTDKTNYEGDGFEKYYKVLDKQNNEIATFAEEERQYDYTKYTDRLILESINKNSKITIEVYLKQINEKSFKKVATIPVDISKSTEKIEVQSNLKQYQNNDYSFEYKEDWKLTPKLDTTKVGPNSIYLGALELEIPSTTNSEYTSSIYVKTINKNTTIDEYKEQVRAENTESASEYYEEKLSSEVNLKNQKGYQITAETTDGEEKYIKQDIFTVVNGKVYRITFFGSEKEYNNLKNNIEEFIHNFKVII